MKKKCKCKCKSVETEQDALEVILACPLLKPDEKIRIAHDRQHKIFMDNFGRKYGVKTN